MKTNYLNRTFKRTLGMFTTVCVLGCASMNAQTEIVNVIISAGTPESAISYNIDEVVTMTGVATVPDIGTFDVSFDVTPASGQQIIYDANGWGSNTGADGATFRASTQGNAAVSNITTTNYTGGLSDGNITETTFTDAAVALANNNQDRFTYEVNGTEYASPTKFDTTPFTVDLLSFGPAINSETAFTDLNEFVIKNASDRTQASDRWSIGSLTVQVTVDVSSLSIDESLAKVTAFKLYPNPTSERIAFNMPIHTLKIMDVTGKVVKAVSGKIENLDVSNLSQGIYILKGMTSEGLPLTRKFIKK